MSTDTNGILNGEYKISNAFENIGNVDGKAKTDGGSATEVNRFELGLNLTNSKSTVCDRATKVTNPVSLSPLSTASCTVANAGAILIAGNP